MGKLKKLIDLLQVVQDGLDGHTFDWGNGQRRAWVPKLKECGITLITKTQIQKRGYRIKRGKKPVGTAYFGSPISRHADLYVLEEQCVKIQVKECWNFLDCKIMTGFPTEECPNFANCRRQAQHTNNRKCPLPFYFANNKNSFFEFDTQVLPGTEALVVCGVSDEAQEEGWAAAEYLIFRYDLENSCLKVPTGLSKYHLNHGWRSAEKNCYWFAKNKMVAGYKDQTKHLSSYQMTLGFHEAQILPYEMLKMKDLEYLHVTHRGNWRLKRILEQQIIGWHHAICINYIFCPKNNEMIVSFDPDDEDYKRAIEMGWYPACDIHEAR